MIAEKVYTMKPLILALLILFIVCQGESNVRVEYDKFEDRTVVSIREMPLGRGAIPSKVNAGSSVAQLDLTLTRIYKGRTAITSLNPNDDLFAVISSHDLLVLISPPPITLLIDNQRIKLRPDVLLDIPSLGKDRQAKFPMTVDLLQRIAKSRSAEGRLDQTEFHFTDANKKELTNFLKAISPSPND